MGTVWGQVHCAGVTGQESCWAGEKGWGDRDFSEGRGGDLWEDSLGGRLPHDREVEGGGRNWEGGNRMHSCACRERECALSHREPGPEVQEEL